MRFKSSFGRLIILELEEYWGFPLFEIVLFAALLSILNRITTLHYRQLDVYTWGFGTLLHILIVGVIVPRSFAGSINKREIVVLLSYPVKRWAVLSSKIITSCFVVFGAYALAVLIDIPLLSLNPFQPAPYILMAIIFIRTLFLCTVVMLISIALKNETISMFVSTLLFLGLEFTLTTFEDPYPYLTSMKGNEVMYDYLTSFFYPMRAHFTAQEFNIALGFPLLTSLILIVISLIYFQWMMQID
jgi:ABC-type transport system involved in multi-copper enzyme maturation permease subunit